MRLRHGRLAACLTLALAACAPAAKPRVQPVTPPAVAAEPATTTAQTAMPVPFGLVPWPRELAAGTGPGLDVGPASKIFVTNAPAALRIAGDLAALIARSTGVRPPVTPFVPGVSELVPPGSLLRSQLVVADVASKEVSRSLVLPAMVESDPARTRRRNRHRR